MNASDVLREWKADIEAINTPGSPDNKALAFLIQADWDIDRAIELAESEEKLSCFKCGTPLKFAVGIGSFCPSKDCDAIDYQPHLAEAAE